MGGEWLARLCVVETQAWVWTELVSCGFTEPRLRGGGGWESTLILLLSPRWL
jgi:hypothetical protein